MKKKNILMIWCLAFSINSYAEQLEDNTFFIDPFVIDDNFLEFECTDETPITKKQSYKEQAHHLTEMVGMQAILGTLYIMELWSNSCNAIKKYFALLKKMATHES